MQNEPNKSLEQRVAGLENLAVSIAGLLGTVTQSVNALAINAAAQANDTRELCKILLLVLPSEAESRDAILAQIRRSESESDQREAALSDLAQKLAEMGKQISKNPPPETPPGQRQ